MKELLKQKNVTQTALAKVLKVTVSLVNQWVRGLCEPQIQQLPIIAETLGVSVDEVIACFNHNKKRDKHVR